MIQRASASEPTARRTSSRTERHVRTSTITARSLGAELAGALIGDERVDDLVEITLAQDPVEAVERQADAVVGHPIFLEVVRPDLLRAGAAAGLAPTGLRRLDRLAVLLELQQSGAQDLH